MSAPDLSAALPQLGQYRLIRELGRGGMARVFEAEHLGLRKRVAVKVLHSVFESEATSGARFLREGRAASRVRHPNVVEVFDVGVQDGMPFLVMELLDGQTLSDYLKERGVIPLPTIAQIFLPILAAVRAAHDVGLVHRDLKPSNVMLTLIGRKQLRPVVLDFGISKVLGEEGETLTTTGAVLGTLHYLAPEQTRGAAFSSKLSDQYSLGVMLYQAATGQRPFNKSGQYDLMHAIVTADYPPAEQVNTSLSAEFAEIVRRAMARRPEQRYPSLTELARALLMFANDVDRMRWEPEFGAPEFATRTAGEDTATIDVPGATTGPADAVSESARRARPGARWILGVGVAGMGLAIGAVWFGSRSSADPAPVNTVNVVKEAPVPTIAPAATPNPGAPANPSVEAPPPGTSTQVPSVQASVSVAPSAAPIPPNPKSVPNRRPPAPNSNAKHSPAHELGTNNAPIIP